MRILVNHIGYEARGPKRAVLQGSRAEAAALGGGPPWAAAPWRPSPVRRPGGAGPRMLGP